LQRPGREFLSDFNAMEPGRLQLRRHDRYDRLQPAGGEFRAEHRRRARFSGHVPIDSRAAFARANRNHIDASSAPPARMMLAEEFPLADPLRKTSSPTLAGTSAGADPDHLVSAQASSPRSSRTQL